MIEKYYEALQKRENLRENLVGLRAQIKDEAAKEQFGMESQHLPLTVFLIEDRHACVYLMSSALQHSKHGCLHQTLL